MLAIAAFPLGERCVFVDPSPEAGGGHTSELLVGDYADRAVLDDLLGKVDVITYEFENVSSDAARYLAVKTPVYPPPEALDAAQDRLTEKQLLERMGYDVPRYAAADTQEGLHAAIESVGLPVIVKTRRGGYDGKGQVTIERSEEIDAAWSDLEGRPLIVEERVPFDREVSIIGARGRDGDTVFYPLTQNEHRGGILRTSVAPAADIGSLQERAEDSARKVMEELDYVGVLAIELFDAGGRLLANEMAPRVHNSGHWTIEGAETSQFENHMRAVLGLPLGSTAMRGHAAMVNFIGDLPNPADVLAIPGAHLHLYGKEGRPGRKVGHATVRADSLDEFNAGLNRLREVSGEAR
jgi:5-(carboxyamino)imidazole ribonucleotide synthase